MQVSKMDSIPSNHDFIERESRLRAIPADEIIDGTPIAPLRFRRAKTHKYGRFDILQFGESPLFFCRFGVLVLVLINAISGQKLNMADSPPH
jgi:hypothetical protein